MVFMGNLKRQRKSPPSVRLMLPKEQGTKGLAREEIKARLTL